MTGKYLMMMTVMFTRTAFDADDLYSLYRFACKE